MNRFSKREKVLIYIMLFVVIIIGSVTFLIVPQKKKLDSLRDKREDLKIQQQTFMSDIYLIHSYKSMIEKSKKDISALEPDFFTIMSNEEVESFFSELILSKGLIPESLSIADIVVKTPSDSNKDDSSDKESEDNSESDAPAVKNIKSVSVYFEVTGSFDSVNSLMKDITDNRKLVLLSFNACEQNGAYKATVVTQVDMVEKNEK